MAYTNDRKSNQFAKQVRVNADLLEQFKAQAHAMDLTPADLIRAGLAPLVHGTKRQKQNARRRVHNVRFAWVGGMAQHKFMLGSQEAVDFVENMADNTRRTSTAILELIMAAVVTDDEYPYLVTEVSAEVPA